jgi:hypothetical protein
VTHPELQPQLHSRLRWLTGLFILGLVVSGATAMPLESELNWLAHLLGANAHASSPLLDWIARVNAGVADTNARYPFITYGTDWLAFGHYMIALAFVWAWREPVRNRWLYDYGLIACALVIPYALLVGTLRGIPLGWRLIDCSFGVAGAIPLWLCRRYAARLAAATSSESNPQAPGTRISPRPAR